jgi:hypothetical protein
MFNAACYSWTKILVLPLVQWGLEICEFWPVCKKNELQFLMVFSGTILPWGNERADSTGGPHSDPQGVVGSS